MIDILIFAAWTVFCFLLFGLYLLIEYFFKRAKRNRKGARD